MSLTIVLLDTSFVLTMVSQHRELKHEIRTYVPGPAKLSILDLALYEIERLARSGPTSTSRHAKVALEVLDQEKVETVKAPHGPSSVDLSTVIYSLTEQAKVIVATVDRKLRQMLAANGVATLSLRKRFGMIISESKSRSA